MIINIQIAFLSSPEGTAGIYCAFKQSLISHHHHIITKMGQQSFTLKQVDIVGGILLEIP